MNVQAPFAAPFTMPPAPGLHRADPAPQLLSPRAASALPSDGHRLAGFEPSPISPRSTQPFGDGAHRVWGAHNKHGSLSSAPKATGSAQQQSAPQPSTRQLQHQHQHPQHPQHTLPPPPQEPKLTNYDSQTSPRFPSSFSTAHSQAEWGPRPMPPAMPSFAQQQHHQYHHDHAPHDGYPHHRPHQPYPGPLSNPPAPHYPPSRSYSESHINTQLPYRTEAQFSPPPPPAHSPGAGYDHGFSDRQALPPHHSHYDRHSSFSIPRREPPTPSSGTISPNTPMDGHMMMRRPSGTNGLDALANATTIKDSRSHQNLRQSISIPPYHPDSSVYPGPSLQRHASFDSLGSADRDPERALKRQRTDEHHSSQLSPFNPNSSSAISEESQSPHKAQQKKRKMTIDTSIPESSASPSSANPPSSAGQPNYGSIPFNKEWGWTKGGKPRQRLPLACLSCRHKKIKCRPSEIKGERCTHCSKMNLECLYGKKESKSRSGKESSKNGPSMSPETPTHAPPPHESEDTKVKEESREDSSIAPDVACSMMRNSMSPDREATRTTVAYSPESKDKMDIDVKPAYTQTDIMIVNEPQQSGIIGAGMQSPSLPDSAYRTATSSTIAQSNSTFSRNGSGAVHTPMSHASMSPKPLNSPAASSATTASDGIYYDSARPRHGRLSLTPKIDGGFPVGIPPPMNSDSRHVGLPDAPTLEHLVGYYFTHVYSQTYAFLHRKSFMADLHKPAPYKNVLLLSLCAVAARFSEDQRHHEERYAQYARQEILNNFDQNKLEVVQAMLLMGLHDFGSQNGDKAWMFCGMAVRMGAALNLNLPSKASPKKTFIQHEIERRTYWSYYLMDRFNSYGVARPFLTQDEDCQIQLPVDQPSFDYGTPQHTEFLTGDNPNHPNCGNLNMGAMAFLVRITSIWAKILRAIHFHRNIEKNPNCDAIKQQTFDELHAECLEWDRKLPKGLRYSSENIAPQVRYGTVGSFVMMHVMFHASMIYLYRYIHTVGVSKDYIASKAATAKLVMGIRKAFVHGDAVLQIVEHVHRERVEADRKGDTPVVVIAPFLGHIIRDGCEIALKRLPTMPEGVARENQLRRVKQGLEWVKELKKYWKPLENISVQLEKLVRQTLRKQAKAASNSPAVSNTSLDISSGSGTGQSPLMQMSQTNLMGPPGVPVPPTSYPMYQETTMYELQTFEDTTPFFCGFPISEMDWTTVFNDSDAYLMEAAGQELGFPNLYDPSPMAPLFDDRSASFVSNPGMDLPLGAEASVIMGTGVPLTAPIMADEPEPIDSDPVDPESSEENLQESTSYFKLEKAAGPDEDEEGVAGSELQSNGDGITSKTADHSDDRASSTPGGPSAGHGLGNSMLPDPGHGKEKGRGDLLAVLDTEQGSGLGTVVKEVEIAEKSACEKSVVNGETITEDGPGK